MTINNKHKKKNNNEKDDKNKNENKNENKNKYDEYDDEYENEEKENNEYENIEIEYPQLDDDEFQYKIYNKREFYYYKTPLKPILITPEDIMKYREKVCDLSGNLPHQELLSNFINPNTPYKGIIAYHGTGTGKTFVGIAIGEKFKPLLKRYNSKVHIIVPGPVLKNKWKNDIIIGTGNEYLKKNANLVYLNSEDRQKQLNIAIKAISNFYRIMSYKSFSRKILGDKVIIKKTDNTGKTKTSYKKNKNGDFDREFVGERIFNLDNSLLIIDEAHNFVNDSDRGEALKLIIKNSTNLKIVLLTATPMNNYADEIIELLNFIRPLNDQIERNKMFSSKTNYEMELKKDGLEYFKKMSQGYISHMRGGDPITFAKRVEMGIKPKNLMFTKLIQCEMEGLQLETYNKVMDKLETDFDSLDTKSSAISNFCFPIMDIKKKKIIGGISNEGLNELKNQIKNNYEKLNELIGLEFFGIENSKDEYINFNNVTMNITGKIFNKLYLKNFSYKFYKALIDIEENLFTKNDKKNESKTGFVYSNLVKSGIDIFKEVLLQNGYLEYEPNYQKYNIKEDTICYFCGISKKNHKQSDTHNFKPATFLTITGQTNEGEGEMMQDDKLTYVNEVYSHLNNKNGENIKLILGSRVMNEGFSLFNVGSVFILDAYYTLGRIEQIIGRGIRWCSHYKSMSIDNLYPKVKVFKYVSSLKNKVSSEEELYAKAEIKFLLVKKIEKVMKENAIDCALNFNGNTFKDENDKFNKCIEPSEKTKDSKEYENKLICPTQCDFTSCAYKCNNEKLNLKYYDRTQNIYKKLNKWELDYSTFTTEMARSEINFAKTKIKELYIISYIYNLESIINYVRNSYDEDHKDLYGNFFTYKALDELIPITQNDFNNFTDIIYDKIHKPGYLIYLDKFYIFQPFSEDEKLPLYYRKNKNITFSTSHSLNLFLKLNSTNIENELKLEELEENNLLVYDFESVINYYNSRDEFEYVGIIDKDNETKNKSLEKIKDNFKLREKLKNDGTKKSKTVQTFKGSVCNNSKTKKYITNIAKKLKIKNMSGNRDVLCNKIMEELFNLEKYSIGENKKTYLIIPANHPTYKFPLNLEDRIQYLKNKTNDQLQDNINYILTANKNQKEYKLSFVKELNNENIKYLLKNDWIEIKENNFEIIIN